MAENTLPTVPATDTIENVAFKGYTLDELRYQKALALLKREFARQKIETATRHIKNDNALLSGNLSAGKIVSLAGGGKIASKMLGGLNVLDYAMIGFSAFRSLRKIGRLFHRGRKG